MSTSNLLLLCSVGVFLYVAFDAMKSVNWSAYLPKKPVTPEPPPLEKDLPSVRYIQVQNSLLDIKDLCHDCPEALSAIDAAIRATVAMVVKGGTSGCLGSLNWNTPIKSVAESVSDALKNQSPIASVKQPEGASEK